MDLMPWKTIFPHFFQNRTSQDVQTQIRFDFNVRFEIGHLTSVARLFFEVENRFFAVQISSKDISKSALLVLLSEFCARRRGAEAAARHQGRSKRGVGGELGRGSRKFIFQIVIYR